MKYILILTLVLSFLSCNQDKQKQADAYFNQAERLYDDKEKEEAKKLYLKSSKKGNLEAHYQLTFKYLKDENSYYHMSTAAELGHEKSLMKTLNYLILSPDTFKQANPKEALKIYNKAIQNNIKIKLDKDDIKILEIANQYPKLNVANFIKSNKITEDKCYLNCHYYVWTLAEEASRGERFKNASPKLTMQLILRGAQTSRELYEAVTYYHDQIINNKENVLIKFDICDFVSSTTGYNFCYERRYQIEKKKNNTILTKIKNKTSSDKLKLFNLAYKRAKEYFRIKSTHEELHGGGGAEAEHSNNTHLKEHIELLDQVFNNTFIIPNSLGNLDKNKVILDNKHKKALAKLSIFFKKKLPINIGENILIKTQKKWKRYLKYNVEILSYLSKNKELDTKFWENYLTEKRIVSLITLNEDLDFYQDLEESMQESYEKRIKEEESIIAAS